MEVFFALATKMVITMAEAVVEPEVVVVTVVWEVREVSVVKEAFLHRLAVHLHPEEMVAVVVEPLIIQMITPI